MTKVIHICDQCKKEVDWVYEMPRLVLEGLKINLYPARIELCENCAKERLAIYNCENQVSTGDDDYGRLQKLN